MTIHQRTLIVLAATLAAVATVLWFIFGGIIVAGLLKAFLPTGMKLVALPLSWAIYFLGTLGILWYVRRPRTNLRGAP